jgi:tetratricopeptide (TPR) repeat protein
LSRRIPLYLSYISYILPIFFLFVPILQDKCYSQELPPNIFEKGVEALQRGDLKTAEEIFRAVLKSDPEDPFAYFNLGSIFAATRRIDSALTVLNRAVELKPDLVAAHLRLAEIYEGQGNLGEALREYEEAYLYLDDGFPLQEKTILARIENLEKTIYFRQNWERGITLFRKGNYQESEAAFREVLRMDPNHAFAHFWLGTILGVQNRFDDAIESFKASLGINPNLADSRMRLVELYELKGDLVAARVEVERALIFVEDRDGPEMQSLEEKLNVIDDQIEVNSYIEQALNEVEDNNIDGAILTLQSLIKINPNQALAYFNLGNLWARKNRIDLAEASFKKALEIQPNYSEAHQRLGQIYELIGYFDRAKREYQKSQARFQRTDQFHMELENLVARVEQQIKSADVSTHRIYEESQKLLQNGNIEEAIAKLEQAISVRPEDPNLHYQLGELYRRNGKIDLAINEMLGVLEFDPGHVQARQQLGSMYEEKGYLYQALKMWKEAETLHPSSEATIHLQALEEKLSRVELETAPLIHKAEEKSVNGKWTSAIETLKQALMIAPDDIRIRIKLALLYSKVGNTTEAYRELNTVSLQDPSTGEEQYYLGFLYSSAGQWEDTKRAYESAVKAKALSESLRSKIQIELERVKLRSRNEKEARRYFSRGNRYMNEQDYRRAIESFEKVIRFYPSDVASLFSIGSSYESLGDDDQARRYYKKVLEINPMNVQANQRLAFLNEKEGKVEKAIERYRHTLDLLGEGDSPDVLWVKGRLSPLEKRYTVNLSQVILGYDSNPSGASNAGGDISSSLGFTFNYYLKKDRRLQIPLGFSTQNTVFFRTNIVFSSETFSVSATTFQDPYSLSFEYNFYLGVARGGPTSRGQTGILSIFKRGNIPSAFGFTYSYDDFYDFDRESNDAVRQRIKLSAVQNWDLSSVNVSYSYFDNDANLNDQAYYSHGVGVSYSRPFLDNVVRGSISYNLEWKEFKNPDSFIKELEGRSAFRRNFLHTFTLTGLYFLQDNLSLGASYTDLRNQSNYPAVFTAKAEQRLSGQAESLGSFRENIYHLFLNWSF